MRHQDLLVEIGCEELPPQQINDALTQLAAAFERAAGEARIKHGYINKYATPRRLTLLIEQVAVRQDDLEQLRIGPPVSAAFDDDGEPTRALQGFVRAQGVSIDDLKVVNQTRRKKTAQYVAALVKESGGPSARLLPLLLEDLPKQIRWLKGMKWGNNPQAFARPVHWIVALFGDEVLDISFAGVRSGRSTRGHRFHFPGNLELGHASEYVQVLEDHKVLVDIGRRRKAIDNLAHASAEAMGGFLVRDSELLDEITHIVEWPIAIRGTFDPSFLELPDRVLVTSMKKHQRYFSVVDEEGKMMPSFITIANTETRRPALVAKGNQRVLQARLKDAEFFFREDQKNSLESYNTQLRRVTYVHKLGSVYDKVIRIEAIAAWIAGHLGFDAILTAEIQRAATLCKADLCTGMVGEFADLQGYIGGEYARLQGEPDGVSKGIAEHYAPRGAQDALPESTVGAIVSMADRIDSIVGLFAIGKIPTGAADRYSLRRAALGLVRISLSRGDRLHLPALIEAAVQAQPTEVIGDAGEALAATVLEFIHTRMRHFLTKKHAAEVVDAVLSLGAKLEDLPAAMARIEALGKRHKTAEFEPLGVLFKRAGNILKEIPEGPVDEALLKEPSEVALRDATAKSVVELKARVEARDFVGAFDVLVALRPSVDTFFDDVLVNAPEVDLKLNRHRLLRDIMTLLNYLADIRRL